MDNAVALAHSDSTSAAGHLPVEPAACHPRELHEPHYWPTELLSTFTLLMAGHGRCVSSAMMLGDREYALWQLARAHTMDDDRLREVAVQLFSYFDSEHHWARATVYHS